MRIDSENTSIPETKFLDSTEKNGTLRFMWVRVKIIFPLALCLLVLSCTKNTPKLGLTPDQAVHNLMAGNKRYVQGQPIHPDETEKQRTATLNSQEPFAIIVGCSDSRVPPEIIFDQGLGDIFVVRVAGNVVGPVERDSIEFAADQLKVPLIMVLGHQKCGAVNAVVSGKIDKNEMEAIAPFIQPAVEKAKTLPGDLLTNSIMENVKLVVADLKANPILSQLIQSQHLNIIGGYYQLDNGEVLILK
jgi:carbonic anhydrase